MSIHPDHPAIRQAYARGLIADAPAVATAAKRKPARKPEMVPEEFAHLAVGKLRWVLPIPTASESNGREWRDRSARTQVARRIVSRAFGKRLVELAAIAAWYHADNPIAVRLTRLGGRKLDPGNISSALKATEDAVALLLGADDGDDRWRVSFGQEPGGDAGVRVELEILEGHK